MSKVLTLAFALFLLSTSFISAQDSPRYDAYKAFDVFVGAPWEVDAYFMDGARLQQKFEVTKGADGKIYKSKTWQKDSSGDYKLKSEGIRAWDDKTRSFKFWEFGVDGSMVTGAVVIEGKNILYIYEYGDEIVTDVYSFERDGVFEYIIGVKDGDKWMNIYANGGVRRK